MSKSDNTSLDDLIAHLVAGLHASRTLNMAVVEELLRMSLIDLGQRIAGSRVKKKKPLPAKAAACYPADAGNDSRPKKPRKTKRPHKAAVRAPHDLSVVIDLVKDASDAGTAHQPAAILQHRPGHPAIPRRRLPSRRAGGRG